MRKVASLALAVCMAMVIDSTQLLADEWFDMKNCAVCKSMGEHMDIMQHIKWETHLVNTGMMSVSIIPAEYQAVMKEAHEKMEATIEKLKSGEQMHLCGFCESYRKLMAQGAKSEDFETDAGHVSLLTSTDPQVVAQIHDHAKKTMAEYKKWHENMAHGHAGAAPGSIGAGNVGPPALRHVDSVAAELSC